MKKILVVEDDRSLVSALENRFHTEGFTVFSAKNGKEGLDIVAKENPDLVLLDILMPKMDGLEMLKELRAKNNSVPVILLTNVAFDDAKLKALMDFNASFYFVKSDIKIEDLVLKVREIFESNH